MKILKIVSGMVALSLMLLATPAAGQASANCAPVEIFESSLEGLGEKLVYAARSTKNPGWTLLVYVQPDTGSFTIIAVNLDGIACLNEYGNSWVTADPEPVGDPV
jgi:hypothetical protein